MSTAARPYHFANGGSLKHIIKRSHAACVLCKGPFEGTVNQKVCPSCHTTPEYREWRHKQQRKSMARSRRLGG